MLSADKANNGKRHSESSDEGVSVKKKKSGSKDREQNGKSHKSSKRSRSKDRHKDKSSRDEEKSKKDRKRSRSKERRRKSRSKSRDKDKRKRSKSREKRRDRDEGGRRDRDRGDRDKEKERDRGDRRRSRSNDRRRRRSPFSPRPFRRGRTPPNGVTSRGSSEPQDLLPEERDARTVFCMQLAQRVKARDLEEFFSSVGKVKDVRLITCNKTKRFKGIAYVEFKDPMSVALAMGLSGQKLLGIPIIVQHTQAEKNRLANAATPPPVEKTTPGPMRLYVGSLHFQVTEDMLEDIFKPFGRVDNIQLIRDPESGQSKGYGFITYHYADHAKDALLQLNGFELAGRPMKVGNVTERLDVTAHASLDTDEMDRSGIDLGATGRLQLMCKLAEKTDLEIPQVTANALMASVSQPTPPPMEEVSQPVATQCFLLVNMFDPDTETDPNWDVEIRDDVIEECNKHGGVQHVFVDVNSKEGKVYVKCPSKATAVLAVNALHGRWFAGRVIAAAYVPLETYHMHFPESMGSGSLLKMARGN